jgi:hypothetical protein
MALLAILPHDRRTKRHRRSGARPQPADLANRSAKSSLVIRDVIGSSDQQSTPSADRQRLPQPADLL